MRAEDRPRDRKLNNRGSSLITVLAVITVLMAVVLSVLAMSYRYFLTESGSIYRQKGNEAARSLAEELGDELIKADYQTADEALNAKGFWQYVRKNMGPSWLYFDSGTVDRAVYQGSEDQFIFASNDFMGKTDIEEAGVKRKFKVEPYAYGAYAGFKDEMPEMEVTVYWELGKYMDRLNDSRLYVEVSCRMGDHISRVTKKYRLTTAMYSGGNVSDKVDGIYKYQKWIWKYEGEI